MKQSILIVSVALCILILSGNALAVELQYYGVEDTINDDLSVTNNVVLKFNSSINHLDYSLDFKVEDLQFESDFEFSDCMATDNNGGSTISCDFIGITPEKNKLTLTFITRDVIQKVGDNYRFTVNYGIPLPIDSNFVLIRLPQNNILAGETNESFFPSDGATLTDGRHIMVFWEEETLETGENLQFSILFTRPPLGADFLNFLIYAFVIGAIIAAVIFTIYVRRTRKSKIAVVKAVLNRDEKRIIDVLNQKDGRAGQKIIVRETDFSKAKVSRIVKNLKDRGVVDIEPISGRENRVILKFGESPEKKEPE